MALVSRWRPLRKCAYIVFLVGLSACASGSREFDLYRQSYALQYAEGERVVERFGAAERKLWRETSSSSIAFNPADAAYYVDAGDPPLAGSVRATLLALREYNDLLASMASGEAGTRLASGVGSLYSNIGQASSNLSIAIQGPLEVSAAAAVLDPAVSAVINVIAREASKASFRRQLLEAYPAMQKVLSELKAMTPRMYELIRASELGRLGHVTDQRQLEADKKLLASWVILIDASSKSMSAAYEAVRSGNSTISLSALNDASVELRVLSETLRAERMKN